MSGEKHHHAFGPHTLVSQSQREALVDLLLMVMYADGAIKSPERDLIQRISSSFTWEGEVSIDRYLGRSIAQARGVLNDEVKEATLLRDIGARLGSYDAKCSALAYCQGIAESDGVVDSHEVALMRRAEIAFGV